MHKRVLLSLALAMLLLQQQQQPAFAQPPERTLRMGGFVVEPLVMGGETEPMRGALPDFIKKEIAPQTTIRFEWTPAVSFARAMKGLRDGSLDIVLIYGLGGSAPPDIGRFEWSLLSTAPHLAVNEDSPLRVLRSVKDLADMEIGGQYGSAIGPDLLDVPIKWDRTTGQNWQTINLRKLKAGRLQGAFFSNPYSPSYIARKEGIAIRLLAVPLPESKFTMAYSLSTDKALIDEFGRLAARAFKDEAFRQSLARYLE